jgi:uncharacterized membrane-anchored protein YitT (DUF2179 family)
MNPFEKLLKDQAARSGQQVGEMSAYRAAKQLRNFRKTVIRTVKDFILIVLGIFSASIGVKWFLLPNGFIDGGCTGISMLINKVMGTKGLDVPLSLILVIVNTPFLLLGLKTMGKKFFARGILAIVGFAICCAAPSPGSDEERVAYCCLWRLFTGAWNWPGCERWCCAGRN